MEVAGHAPRFRSAAFDEPEGEGDGLLGGGLRRDRSAEGCAVGAEDQAAGGAALDADIGGGFGEGAGFARIDREAEFGGEIGEGGDRLGQLHRDAVGVVVCGPTRCGYDVALRLRRRIVVDQAEGGEVGDERLMRLQPDAPELQVGAAGEVHFARTMRERGAGDPHRLFGGEAAEAGADADDQAVA